MIIIYLKSVESKQNLEKAINVEPNTRYSYLFLNYMVFEENSSYV